MNFTYEATIKLRIVDNNINNEAIGYNDEEIRLYTEECKEITDNIIKKNLKIFDGGFSIYSIKIESNAKIK